MCLFRSKGAEKCPGNIIKRHSISGDNIKWKNSKLNVLNSFPVNRVTDSQKMHLIIFW